MENITCIKVWFNKDKNDFTTDLNRNRLINLRQKVPNLSIKLVVDKNHLYLYLKVIDNYVEYYTGFTWLKSKQFDDKESWNNYLDNFSLKLNNPLKIEI